MAWRRGVLWGSGFGQGRFLDMCYKKDQSFATTLFKPNDPIWLKVVMPQNAHETLMQASSCRTLSEGDLSRMVSWAMFADKSWENTKLNRIYQEVLMGNNSYARDPPSTRLVSAIVNNPFLPSESVQTGKYHTIIWVELCESVEIKTRWPPFTNFIFQASSLCASSCLGLPFLAWKYLCSSAREMSYRAISSHSWFLW